MRYAVFSDVHGNLPALETMLEQTQTVDGYICLGDVVDYGPWSNECVELVNDLPNLIFVQGNHEQYFLEGAYGGSSLVAKQFFDFCYPSFTQYDKIADLPQEYELNGYLFSHTINNQNVYPDSDLQLITNHVIGHSHHQFMINQLPYKLFNPGSVGQNRQYINIINYALLETTDMHFEFKGITYDESIVLNEMKTLGYPKDCIAYYANKPRLT